MIKLDRDEYGLSYFFTLYNVLLKKHQGHFENDVFVFNDCIDYCTCGFEDICLQSGIDENITDEWLKSKGWVHGADHTKDCLMNQPNFYYKPTNLVIEWYKYPFRSSESNREFSADEFIDIVRHCRESIGDYPIPLYKRWYRYLIKCFKIKE